MIGKIGFLSKTPPLALLMVAALGCANAWLLIDILDNLFGNPPPPAITLPPRHQVLFPAPLEIPKSMSAYTETLAHPVFFKTRAPFVPPPPPPPPVPAPPPPVVIADPGLSLGGVIIESRFKKAYLVRPNEAQGTWVSEGDYILGWTVQSVTSTSTLIKQSSRTIELDLYPKR